MKHLHNQNAGTLHLWHKQSDKRLNLRPGVNQVSDEDCKLFERLLSNQANLKEVKPLNDVPVAAKVEDLSEVVKEDESLKEVKKSKKSKKADPQVEQINE